MIFVKSARSVFGNQTHACIALADRAGERKLGPATLVLGFCLMHQPPAGHSVAPPICITHADDREIDRIIATMDSSLDARNLTAEEAAFLTQSRSRQVPVITTYSLPAKQR
jgi:hypothetical protein